LSSPPFPTSPKTFLGTVLDVPLSPFSYLVFSSFLVSVLLTPFPIVTKQIGAELGRLVVSLEIARDI